MWAEEENFNAQNILYTERDLLKEYKVFSLCCLIKDGLGTL